MPDTRPWAPRSRPSTTCASAPWYVASQSDAVVLRLVRADVALTWKSDLGSPRGGCRRRTLSDGDDPVTFMVTFRP